MQRSLLFVRKVRRTFKLEIAGFFAIAVALIALGGYLAHLSARAREARFASLYDFCIQNGFEYAPSGHIQTSEESFLWMNYNVQTDSIVETFKFHSLFQQGHSQKAAPVMAKSEKGVEWLLFDYRYLVTTSNGKTTTTTTYNNSVAVAHVPFQFPVITLTPQNFFHSIGKVFGSNELETESIEFNDRYFVKTQDQKRATEILVPEVLEFFVHKEPRHWHWNGPYLITYVPRNVTADEYEVMWREVKFLIENVPNYYKVDHS
jgi:hypothetical protein